MFCNKCGKKNSETSLFCMFCGEKLPLGCPSCGHLPPEEASFCPHCGCKLKELASYENRSKEELSFLSENTLVTL